MSIKSFIEDSEREFDKKFTIHQSHGKKLKSFTSSKLRELIGEVKAEVEGMKKEPLKDGSRIVHKVLRAKQQGANSVLDSVLHLLDEAGGK